MANANLPPDPPSPPALTAAELRRRLLASTPPPIAATASTPDGAAPAGEPAAEDIGRNSGSALDLLGKLRMPGKSGPVPAPAARTAAVEPESPAAPARPSLNRRTPSGGIRYPDDPTGALAGSLEAPASPPPADGQRPAEGPRDDRQRLKAENKELRKLLQEMKSLLQEASDNEQQFTHKEKDYKAALAEKDAQIQELSAQLGTIEEQIAKGELAPPPPIPKTRTELDEWADDLEKESARLTQERKRVDEERRQLRDDEEALEKQMREMEVSMARERALLARQETELKRLSAEIQHELDLMQRGDNNLREQMAKFQRRAQEVFNKSGGNGRR